MAAGSVSKPSLTAVSYTHLDVYKRQKYDIRDWSPDGSRMAKGISLTEDELKTLKGILDDMEL